MFLKPSNCNISSSDEEVEVPVPKKKLTRKEKKGKQHHFSRHRPLAKFEISQEDKQVRYKRNGKKNAKRLKKYNLNYRTFDKAEAIFNKWFAENKHRFNVKPIHHSDEYNHYHYYFEGVVKSVDLNIEVNGPEVSLGFTYYGKDNMEEEDSQYFDQQYLEYIMGESFHPQKGFYNSDNVTGNFDYFPTREALYINQVFEVALKSCNEMLVPENSLYLFDSCGCTSAFIDATDESNKENMRVYRDETEPEIVNLSHKECFELLKQSKVRRLIKYDLFQPDKKPLIRYYWREKRNV